MPTTEPNPSGELPTGIGAAVDATAGRVAAAGLGLASFIRRRRIFHPYGTAFDATLLVEPGDQLGATLLDEPAIRPCTVRLSRGIGLPEPTRDVLGVALRVLDERGEPLQDLLFATVIGEGAASRHVLAPAPSFAHRPFSTILPYRTRRSLVSLTLHARQPEARGLNTLEASASAFEAGELTFTMRATTPGGRSQTVGHLAADRRQSQARSEDIRFNPFTAMGDLRPAGALNALRRRAYGASQAARPRHGWSEGAARS